MQKNKALKISELINKDSILPDPAPGTHLYINQIVNELSMSSISQSTDYTEPYIYYGCSNRVKKGGPKPSKPKMDITKDWYIMYREYCPELGRNEPVCIKAGINEYHTIGERERIANNCLSGLKKLLKDGFRKFSQPAEDDLHGIKFRSIEQALNAALKIKLPNLKTDKSRLALSSDIGLWIKVFNDLRYDFPICDLTTKHIYIGWERLRNDREQITGLRYGVKRHLDLQGSLRRTLRELKKLDVWPVNPASDMDLPKKPKKGKTFIPWTEEELKKVATYTKYYDWRYYVNLKLQFRAGLRAVESLRLKPGNIIIDEAVIRMLDYMSKNGENKEIPLDDDLINDLKALHLENINPDHYIFSDRHTLEPGPTELNRVRLSERFARIRAKVGIDKSKKMGALKHTRGKIQMTSRPAPIPDNLTVEEMLRMILGKLNAKSSKEKLAELQILFRHSEADMSRVYAEGDEVELRENLKTNYPPF